MKGKSATPEVISISPPRFRILSLRIEGTTPYMQLRFSEKSQNAMMDKMKEGGAAKSKNKRAARDFDMDFQQAQHRAAEGGWNGIPASAFRNACIDACRMAGFVMTRAKMSLFIEADGLDVVDATPLVKIIGAKPEMSVLPVRNATGVVDIRARAMWKTWKAVVRVKFDEDILKASDVVNLLDRAGQQVGIGEGRPFSKNSNGIGYGTFRVTREGGEKEK